MAHRTLNPKLYSYESFYSQNRLTTFHFPCGKYNRTPNETLVARPRPQRHAARCDILRPSSNEKASASCFWLRDSAGSSERFRVHSVEWVIFGCKNFASRG